mmetsp:Transcript_34836/g.100125  ORF Transcript_34836/g.100125 Transcript_34836/m.100125 type:complete len:352 (+) Transcript_34836:105-1160(+)
MQSNHDLYAVLGLSEDAGPEEIRKAYRSLALRCHPDKSRPEERAAAERSFKELVGAYDVLRDPQRRSEYDTSLRCTAPMRRSFSSPTTRVTARSRPCSPSHLLTRIQRAHEASPVRCKPCWGWRPASPTAPSRDVGVTVLNPGSIRVRFAGGSACIGGPASTGKETKRLADARVAALQGVGKWAVHQSAARIDIRGCSERGEVGSSLRERDTLGLARCQKTLAFLTSACGVPAERCHASCRLGEDFPGVEIRSMVRLEVEGSFSAKSGPQLMDDATLDVVAAATNSSPTKHLLLEVHYTGKERLAQRRISALRQALTGLGIARHRICGRTQAGLAEEVSFLLYEELLPVQD